jgi:hypothetical protein
MASWVIKKIQSPFTGQGVSNANWKKLATIQHIPVVQCRLEVGTSNMFLEHVICFWIALVKGFPKTYHAARQLKTFGHKKKRHNQKTLVARGFHLPTLQWRKNFDHRKVSDWIFLIIISLVIKQFKSS